ncbi:uncharacterized protein MKK02DRAFT_36639 [Dioszegia hungarica]|uniref:RNI-like protein n=1 Tax=Dioszegia hungarica TaxID=4972 RepID=A0AA38LV45_9TREE|nr:uncharacterized protein MKK02DRAFT_36639 [Dioszegia hungarica]KAI9635234.1 hypothetical protein MKK02DRAFT_36639 [Dioszegia hungarica]
MQTGNSDLPLETLSHAISLLAPPFYADNRDENAPPAQYHRYLDPPPFSGAAVTGQISQVSKACHVLLEASRPWLWESVDVQGGRGWLAIVNALTEEVLEENNEDEEAAGLPPAATLVPKTPTLPSRTPPSMFAPVIGEHPIHPSFAPDATLASTPILSPTWTSPLAPLKIEGLPMPATKSILTSPSPIILPSKLRGRSRSPRRSIGFADEGIQAVMDRSLPTSISLQRPPGLAWPRRPSFSAGRRTSLNNVNNREEDCGDMEMYEEGISSGIEGMDVGTRRDGSNDSRILTPPRPEPPGLPPAEEEHWLNCNPELLPPPGPYIRHLSFVNFRTIGSRRSQEEAVRGRFVTGGRLEGFIKNAPNLVSLCMTEYVDSALSSQVIEELFFRGTKRPRIKRRLSSQRGSSLSRIRSVSLGPSDTSQTHDQLDPPRPTYVPYEHETEDQQWRRRAMFTPLEALDLTGCVSRTFQDGMREFYEHHYAPDEAVSEEESGGDRGRGRSRKRAAGNTSSTETETEDEGHSRRGERSASQTQRRPPMFPHLHRLSLRGCLGVDEKILDAILPSFSALTHLDLSGTKVSSSYLTSLIDRCPRSLRLTSLSLARCPRLDPFVVVQFLCFSPAVNDLRELNLYTNRTQGNALRSDDLLQLITKAPCIKSGKLRYLDISSAMLKAEHLLPGTFPPQPSLVSLGLSHIPLLPLPPIATFLLQLAPNVEILTLTGTAADTALRPANTALQLTLELHARLINPLTTVPFSMAEALAPPGKLKNPGPSRLRVIELSSSIRNSIGPEGGSNEWKVIRSKGGRGWYVDVSAGWIEEVLEDGKNTANGRVSSGVGWHSRKMEVVKGYGMLGREEGLAGAGAFAFEE